MILINFAASFRFRISLWRYLISRFCVCILFQLSFYAFTSSPSALTLPTKSFIIIFFLNLIFSQRAHRIHATRFCLHWDRDWDVCWSLITSTSPPIVIGIGQSLLSSLKISRQICRRVASLFEKCTIATCSRHADHLYPWVKSFFFGHSSAACQFTFNVAVVSLLTSAALSTCSKVVQ